MPRIALLAIGNVLMGDDGVGPRALALLAAGYEVPPSVEVQDLGTPGLHLVPALAGREAVVVLDALRAPGAAGEVRELDREAVLQAAPRLVAGPHDPGLREALVSAELVGEAPRAVHLVGVVTGAVQVGTELSPAVEAALPAAVELAVARLRALGVDVRRRDRPRAASDWRAGARGRRVEIRGTVQGVGMRPFVRRLALSEGLTGSVKNRAEGVAAELFGPQAALEAFTRRLRAEAPPAARIHAVIAHELPFEQRAGFEILASAGRGRRRASVPPDLATCPACLAELRDPADRRHRYPFTNCTVCGPRFTIVHEVPYDRPSTTMAAFALCPECRREYEDPDDRRHHAQPNACPACGPRLTLLAPDGSPHPAPDALRAAAAALRKGRIVAVKGLGGFHLACDATDPGAVRRLRERKQREAKPLAVMVRDLEAARTLARIGDAEAELLCAPERPIVLLRTRAEAAEPPGSASQAPPAAAPEAGTEAPPAAALAPEVAPDGRTVGLLLPYTPLHHLLLEETGRPLVMTSGNLSEAPIVTGNAEAVRTLGALADLLLVHDRDIANRADDSVARIIDGAPVLLRRARGFVPRPIRLGRRLSRAVLGCGGHVKGAVCLARDDEAVLGPHVGDLDDLATCEAYEEATERLETFFDLRPEAVGHDHHPSYYSTRYALERATALGIPAIAVQHHHAHVASALAEHRLEGPALGLAWDGTGLGTDGALWGGELLLADLRGFERLATLRPLPLPGGEAAIREPWRLALALLDDAFDGAPPVLERFACLRPVDDHGVALVRRLIETGVGCPKAHGAGRWFDAAAALVLGRGRSRYEGQLAMALEAAAEPGDHGAYPFEVQAGTQPAQLDLRPAARALVGDLLDGVAAPRVAARFHDTLAAAAATVVRSALREHGRVTVLLTGGAFQNRRLAEGVLARLPGADVRLQRLAPPGDGGLALGQAVVAAARLDG